jgi:hypothetical protein
VRLVEWLKLKKAPEALQEIARLVAVGADLNDYLLRLFDYLRQDLVANLDLIKVFLPVAAQLKISPIASLPFEIAIVDYCQPSRSKKDCPSAKAANQNLPPAEKQIAISHQQWHDLLAVVRPQNHSIEGLLHSARPLKLENGCLTLEVFYKFHKEQLETNKCRDVIEKAAHRVLGQSVKLKCILGEKPITKSPKSDIIEVAREIFK